METAEEVTMTKKIKEDSKIERSECETKSETAKDVTEARRADDVTETRRADDVTETRRADDVTETRRLDDVTETRRADDVTETRRADDVTETRRADDVTNTRRADDVANAERVEGARPECVCKTEGAAKASTASGGGIITNTEKVEDVSKIEGNEDIFRTENVPDINKRALGKIIVKYCGNEGNVENEEQTSLRRLLQATSDYLEKEDEKVWKNAAISIYDNEDHSLTVKSGKGENNFVVQYKGKTDEVEVVNTERQKRCCIS